MERMITVNVTADDISRGRRYAASSCAIALAVKRAYPADTDRVCVSPWNVYVNGHEYRLPPEAEEFAEKFDRGEPVKPIEFVATELSFWERVMRWNGG